MDKKYLNIVLIVLLVIIWSGVIYKYFGGKKTFTENIDVTGVYVNQDYYDLTTKDTFSLEFKGDDPFKVTGKAMTSSKPQNTTTKNRKTPKVSTVKNIVWPAITYHGFVKAESQTTRLILIKINNRIYRKREGDQVDELTLVKAYNDSLKISFNNTNKVIKKQ